MSELIFAVKCFGFALLIAFLMQVKVSGTTIEDRAEYFLKRSQVTAYLQDAAAGGANLLQDSYYTAKNFVLDSTRSVRSNLESRESRASRR